MGESSPREMVEVLRRASERLLAATYLYAAASYLVWLVVLSFYMLAVLPLAQGLGGAASAVVNLAYWLGLGLAVYGAVARWFWGYIRRLGASSTGSGCERIMAGWLAVPALILVLAWLLEPVAGDAAAPLALTLALAYGSLVNSLAERCGGERAPVSLAAVALLLAAGVPGSLYLGWPGFSYAVVLSYSVTAMLYLVKAMKSF